MNIRATISTGLIILFSIVLLMSCRHDKLPDISVISETIVCDGTRPKSCEILDAENYGHGYTQYVVRNNTTDTLKLRVFLPKMFFYSSVKMEYYDCEGVFGRAESPPSKKASHYPMYDYFLQPKSIDTLYLCHGKSKKHKNIWYEVEYMKDGEKFSQYLE